MNPNQSTQNKARLIARSFASVLAVASLSMAVIAIPNAPASAATCKNAGGGNKQITVGSQVTGDLVTICASKAFQKQLKKIVKVPVAAKPVAKPVVKKPVVKKPVAKPNTVYKIKPVVKVKPKTKVVKKKVSGSKANSAVFRPAKPFAAVSPGTQLDVGQVATFSSKLAVKYGTAVLFGNLVQVRFTPKQWAWQFGDGALASGVASASPGSSPTLGTAATSHAYSANGNYSALVRVEYAVAYRVKGGSWLADPDTIWLLSNVLNLTVGAAPGSASSSGTVLVSH